MTPYQFAKAECANLLADGSCLGIGPEDLIDFGQTKKAHPKEKCLLTDPSKRCRYFEKAILPLADQKSPKEDPALQVRRLKAREAYFNSVCSDGVSGGERPRGPRRCPGCGTPLGKRQRYCERCGTKRRRESYRRRRDRERSSAPQLTAKQRL